MHKLIVEWTNNEGTKKQWKLAPTDSPVSIGSSKYSEIMFQHPNLKGMHGLLEYKNDKWWYLDFSSQAARANQEISEGLDLDIGNIQLGIHLQAKPKIDFSKIGIQGGQEHQLFLVKHKGETIQTELLKPTRTFKWLGPQGKIEVAPVVGDWNVTTVGEFEIHQKTIRVDSPDFIKHWKEKDKGDNENRMIMGIIGGTALLIATLVAFSPKHGADMGPQATIQQLQISREVAMVIPKKKKKEAAAQAQTQDLTSSQKTAVASNSAAGGAKKLIASFDRSRISKLLGKISAQPAKSKNIIVGNGISAGSAPSGRALAAVGNIDQGGKDWSGDSKQNGITISTFGKGGGNGGLGSYGKLNGGKVGSSGVGLIEEDGEVTGGLDREVIAQYIKSQLGQILYCYERQLSANPNLFGKVSVKFTISGTGAVETQKIGDTSLKSPPVEGCILQKISNWRFPTPKGGTQVLVTYPFLFKSTN